MRIRTQLVVLIVAALLPVALFGAVIAARFWDLQRDAYEQRYLERVRALRFALDTELEGTVRTLGALSRSPAFDEPGSEPLDARLKRLASAQAMWSTIGVIDADGSTRVRVNQASFSGEAVPDAVTVADVRNRRAPAVTNLLRTQDGSAWLTFIVVPVMRQDAVPAVLYVGIDHSAWLEFLRRYPIAAQATLTLNDRNGLVIARTLNNDRWVGKPASADFLARSRESPEGALRTAGLEGQSFYSAFSRSSMAGWTLGTGVPQQEVEGQLRGSTLLTVGGFAAAALLALLLAFVFGRRIAQSVRSLAAMAHGLAGADGASIPGPGTRAPSSEIETVRQALESSGTLLRERQSSLNQAVTREAQARAEAEHANVAKDQFLAMLGHELRNPLSAIANASALMERAPGAADVGARSRAIIQRQVQHLVQIVNDLLDVARLTSGKVVLSKRMVDLAVVVVHSVEALKDIGRVAHLSLDVKVDSAPVLGDETRLEQIATNLVENACKYTPPGGHITVRVAAEGGAAVLEVADDGMGIAPELLPHVFEPFTQGERTLDRAQGGLGLGLPVVKRLVELHGGSVAVHSDGAQQGSRFVVRLPLSTGRGSHVHTTVTVPAHVRLRITLVEDHADTRESLRIMLAQEGHAVSTAPDGASGLAAILSERPDIALVDLGMPGLDGLEVARRVRAADPQRTIRLVALTGYGGGDDHAAALAAGFDDYMVKPFDLARFRLWLSDARAAGAGQG
jgi:signal transduction histidine kinase/ActR/RegA family two-component response regulator